MAKPRVFISSTFYDLRYIRNDLERFLFDLGYEPVMNERGNIPYSKTETLEQSCYREISTCDILVNIIGGKFGSASKIEPYSISQMELKTAQELHKQVYVFIEKPVHLEYHTFLKNEENQKFVPQYVDNIKVYNFIKEVYKLPINNAIADFENVQEVINYLKEQFAGSFQRFLQEDSRKEDYLMSSNLKSTAETLSKIIEYTTKERDETIKTILVNSHPVFEQINAATNIPFRIFFTNYDEMKKLLRSFRFVEVELEEMADEDRDKYLIFERNYNNVKTTLKILDEIFDDADILKPVEHGEWGKKFVEVQNIESNDDLPF